MIKSPELYTLINTIVSYSIYAAVLVFFIVRNEILFSPLVLGYERSGRLREKNGFLKFIFSHRAFVFCSAILCFGVYWSFSALFDVFPFLSNNDYFTLYNYFALLYFGPPVAIVVCLILGADFRNIFDLLSPFLALEMGLGKIACFCAGCCNGIPWANGMYNYNTQRVEFPVQILEAFIGVLIAALLFFLLTRRKTKGQMFPLYLILYGISRFGTEFLRGDHVANWLGMKPFQVLSLIALLIGLIWMLIIRLEVKVGKRFLMAPVLCSETQKSGTGHCSCAVFSSGYKPSKNNRWSFLLPSVVPFFDRFGRDFEAFFDVFSIEGNNYRTPEEGSEGYEKYEKLFHSLEQLSGSANKEILKETTPELDLGKSALIGISRPYIISFGDPNEEILRNILKNVSALFGYADVDSFRKRASLIAKAYHDNAETNPQNRLRFAGAVQTENQCFVFPFTICAGQNSTVLYFVSDKNGEMSLVVGDVTKLKLISESDGSKLYGRCLLFEKKKTTDLYSYILYKKGKPCLR